MGSTNFSFYFEALQRVNRGEYRGIIDEEILCRLVDWGYVEPVDGGHGITQKGLNVLEFYLRNCDFMDSCTSRIQESLIQLVA